MFKEVKIKDTSLEIELSKDARFFFLLGRQDGLTGIHTFFHMGAIDKTGAATPLLEIGKVGDRGIRFNENISNIYCHAAFGKTGAIIRNEGHLIRQDCNTDLSININYTAFEVTKTQYLFFLGILKQINQQQRDLLGHSLDKATIKHSIHSPEQLANYQALFNKALFPNGELSAYQPIDGTDRYSYRPISQWQTPSNGYRFKQTINQCNSLSFFNTCRHTGIDLLNIVLDSFESPASTLISSSYLMPFPCRTTLKAGKYITPLYLMPMPPNSLALAPIEKKIMLTLYHRMEGLLAQNNAHPATRKKFDLLKNIYIDLTKDKASTLNFLETLVEYGQQTENKALINQHRGFHWPFFHTTRTSDMFDSFKHLLQNQTTSDNTLHCR